MRAVKKLKNIKTERKPFRLPFFKAMKDRGLVNDEPPETQLIQSLGRAEAETVGKHNILPAPEKEDKKIKKSVEQLKAEAQKLREKALTLAIKYKAAVDKRIEDKDRARTVDDITLACRYTDATAAWNYINLSVEELDNVLVTYEEK